MMASEPKKQSSKSTSTLLETSKHPLVILLVTTLLGSILIPDINSRATRARELEKLRAERALEAVKTNSEVDRLLNLLLTDFSSFWNDTEDGNFESQRPELRAKIYKTYGEFDSFSWWWYEQAWQEAVILGLIDKKTSDKELEAAYAQYKDSLLASSIAIDRIWDASLRQTPPPSREVAKKELAQARQQIWEARKNRLDALARFTSLLLRRGSESAPNPSAPPDGQRTDVRRPPVSS
jgi:hypothetical protein